MEQRLRLDIRTFRRRGWLRLDAAGVLTWSQDGEAIGSVGFRVAADAVTLDYQTRDDDGHPLAVRCTLPITTGPCRYGGHRRYWLCPRCCRRCEVLASGWGGRAWACRSCLHLRYTSQRLVRADRLQRRAERIYRRLGGEDDAGMIHKPKGMRWRTFDRLMTQAQDFDTAADLAFAAGCMARMGMLPEGFADI